MDNLSPVTADPDVPTKKYVDDGLAEKVSKQGDVISGPLIRETSSAARSTSDWFQAYNGTNTTGRVLLTLPQGNGSTWNYGFQRWKIRGYHYNGGRAEFEMDIGGYAYDAYSTWYNPSARLIAANEDAFSSEMEVVFVSQGDKALGTTKYGIVIGNNLDLRYLGFTVTVDVFNNGSWLRTPAQPTITWLTDNVIPAEWIRQTTRQPVRYAQTTHNHDTDYADIDYHQHAGGVVIRSTQAGVSDRTQVLLEVPFSKNLSNHVGFIGVKLPVNGDNAMVEVVLRFWHFYASGEFGVSMYSQGTSYNSVSHGYMRVPPNAADDWTGFDKYYLAVDTDGRVVILFGTETTDWTTRTAFDSTITVRTGYLAVNPNWRDPTQYDVDLYSAGHPWTAFSSEREMVPLAFQGQPVWLNSARTVGIRENGGAIEFVI